MKQILETERLRLRELTLEDTPFIIELLNSPGWLQFIGDRNVRTEAEAKAYLENGPLKSYRENGYGLYLVEKKDDTLSVGMCGILNRETLDNPDIGFAFLPPYTAQGYAFESASSMLLYARNKLKIPKICAITVPDNIKSISLLEKLGMKFEKKIRLQEDKEELLLHSN